MPAIKAKSRDDDASSGELVIRYRPLVSLEPYARNSRTHSPEQIEQIKRSLQRFGWTTPMVVAGSTMIAGHARLAAGLALAEAGEAIPRNRDPLAGPVVDVSHLTPEEQRAYVIADNQLAQTSGWDMEALRLEMTDLKLADFDLSLIGFGDDQIMAILAGRTDGLTDPDDAPEVPANPVSKPGDVWLLGRHRLVCGDCTSEVDVSHVLAGVKPHLMVTDPPYGVDYMPRWRDGTGLTRAPQTAVGLVSNDKRADWREAWALSPASVAYVWHGGLRAALVSESLLAATYEIRGQIIWVKQGFVFGQGNYHWQHESCWYAVRRGAIANWSGDRKQTTVWQIENANLMKGGKLDDQHTGHSTQKPVECMKRPIENNSSAGQAVYDPFVGSGTTIIAAEMTGRACHAIEISPAYTDVSVLRWQAFTGQDAHLEVDGRSFAEVAAARAP